MPGRGEVGHDVDRCIIRFCTHVVISYVLWCVLCVFLRGGAKSAGLGVYWELIVYCLVKKREREKQSNRDLRNIQPAPFIFDAVMALPLSVHDRVCEPCIPCVSPSKAPHNTVWFHGDFICQEKAWTWTEISTIASLWCAWWLMRWKSSADSV